MVKDRHGQRVLGRVGNGAIKPFIEEKIFMSEKSSLTTSPVKRASETRGAAGSASKAPGPEPGKGGRDTSSKRRGWYRRGWVW